MENNTNKHDDIRKQNRTAYAVMALSLAILGLLIAVSVMSARKSDQKRAAGLDASDPSPAAADSVKELPAAIELPDLFPDAVSESESVDDGAADSDKASSDANALPPMIPVALGAVSKGYSIDVPVYSTTMDDYRVHRGVDIAVPVGSDVFAAADGTVSAVWEDPLSGCALRIDHAGGATSTYYNLSRETLDVMKPGMTVVSGGVVGTVGETSLLEIAEEPHVHYELTVNGEYVDPCEYIDFTNVGESYEG